MTDERRPARALRRERAAARRAGGSRREAVRRASPPFLDPRGDERVLDSGNRDREPWRSRSRRYVREVVGVDAGPGAARGGAGAGRASSRTSASSRATHQAAVRLGSFDLAGCVRTLHHVPRPELVVAELVRVTLPGGCMLVVDQLAPVDPLVAFELNRFERARDPSHTRALADVDMRRLFESNGLVLLRTEFEREEREISSYLDRAGCEGIARERALAMAPAHERLHGRDRLVPDAQARDLVTEALILAGGKAERLGDAAGGRPKPLVEIAGRPLIAYQVEQLAAAGVDRVIVSCSAGTEELFERALEGLGPGDRDRARVGAARPGRRPAQRGTRPPGGRPSVRSERGRAAGRRLPRAPRAPSRARPRGDDHGRPAEEPVRAGRRGRAGRRRPGSARTPTLPVWVSCGVYVLDDEAVERLPERGDHETTTFPGLAAAAPAARVPPRRPLADGQHAEAAQAGGRVPARASARGFR